MSELSDWLDRPNDPNIQVNYFGYLGKHGKALHDGYGNSRMVTHWISREYDRDLPKHFVFGWNAIDGGLINDLRIPDICTGRVYWTCGISIRFKNPNAWCIAFIWRDRSVSEKQGEHSTFFVVWDRPDTEDFDNDNISFEVLTNLFEYAKKRFPEVVSRQKFPLDLQY